MKKSWLARTFGMGCAGSSDSKSGDVKHYPEHGRQRAQGMTNLASLCITIVKAENIPLTISLTESDPYVKIKLTGDQGVVKKVSDKVSLCEPVRNPDLRYPVWDTTILFDDVTMDDTFRFKLLDSHLIRRDSKLGIATISARELVSRPSWKLMLQNDDASPTVNSYDYLPCFLTISVNATGSFIPRPSLDPSSRGVRRPRLSEASKVMWPACKSSVVQRKNYNKHIMCISRGTRGDVQPFVALARGLAEHHNCMVTIVTELRWKEFVKKNAKTKRGCIRYRPSGGDTTSRIEEPIAKMAMNSTSELIQASMLSASEAEFFGSEPCCYYWAMTMKPDVICYGFTLANIAMIISEKLQIPMVGFVLQPTCIPSSTYESVVPIDTHTFKIIDAIEKQFVSHSFQARMKMLMENNLITQPLNSMRKRRGLKPFPSFFHSDTWPTIMNANSPIIVPINEYCWGGEDGKPHDWSHNTKLTDFIFLRGGGVPKLSDEVNTFIADAKEANAKTVVICFSSMPIPRTKILRISMKMIEECDYPCRLIALTGGHITENLDFSEAEILKHKQIEKDGKLLELRGAPYGLLFGKMDCVIMHGGLGTTAEAMRAGVPVMTTGVLLMDQRFWGSRVHALGVGPPAVHISTFEKVCVENLNNALKPDSEWALRAKEIQPLINGETATGVEENCRVFMDLCNVAEPISVDHLYDDTKRIQTLAQKEITPSLLIDLPKPTRARDCTKYENHDSSDEEQEDNDEKKSGALTSVQEEAEEEEEVKDKSAAAADNNDRHNNDNGNDNNNDSAHGKKDMTKAKTKPPPPPRRATTPDTEAKEAEKSTNTKDDTGKTGVVGDASAEEKTAPDHDVDVPAPAPASASASASASADTADVTEENENTEKAEEKTEAETPVPDTTE